MTDTIELFDAPELPGLRFRRFRGAFDLPGIAAIHAAHTEYDQLDPLLSNQRPPTISELAEIYRQRSDFNPDFQMLMAEVHSELIGYAWIRSWAQADGAWVLYHNCQLLPQWRGYGIGNALMKWAEDVLGFAASHRPDGTEAHFRADVYSTEKHAIERLEDEGYTRAQTTLEMAHYRLDDLPAPTLPESFTLHTPASADARAVFFAMDAAFEDEWGYTPKTDDDFETLMASPATDISLWRTIRHGETIAGVITSEAAPPVGLIQELSVGKDWRRRGLGRALLLAGLQALREHGLTQARIYTDAADPFGARHLYESVGFQHVKAVLRYTKPVEK